MVALLFEKKRECEEVLKMLNWVFKLTDAGEFGGAAAAAYILLSCGLKMKPEPVENEWIYIGRFH